MAPYHQRPPQRRLVVTAASLLLLLVMKECQLVAALTGPSEVVKKERIGDAIPGHADVTPAHLPGSVTMTDAVSDAADGPENNKTSSNPLSTDGKKTTSSIMKDYVVWTSCDKPVVNRFGILGIVIVLESPCKRLDRKAFFNNATLNYTIQRCNAKYEEYKQELWDFCPTVIENEEVQDFFEETGTATGRVKRFILEAIIIGVIVIGLIYATWKNTKDIEKLTEDAKITRLNEGEMAKSIELLDDRIRKVQNLHDNLANSFANYVKAGTVSTWEISELVDTLGDNYSDLQNLISYWKLNRLYAGFFKNLGIKAPCQDECPFEYGSPIRCAMNRKRNTVYMQVKLPMIDRTKKIYIGTPITYLVTNYTSFCSLRYTGETAFVVSNETECLIPIDANVNAVHQDYLLLNEERCRYKKDFNRADSITKFDCQTKYENYHLEFVTRVNAEDRSYIYCPGSNFKPANQTVKPCGDFVRTVNLRRNVTINGKIYAAAVVNLGHVVLGIKNDKIYRDRVKAIATPDFDITHLLIGKKDRVPIIPTLHERPELPTPGILPDFNLTTGIVEWAKSFIPDLSILKYIGIGIAVVVIIIVMYVFFQIGKTCLCLCMKVKPKSNKNTVNEEETEQEMSENCKQE